MTVWAAAWSAEPDPSIDADALIARLARPAPASIAFTEVRFSKLLRQPLVVSGELSYSGAASLDRNVTHPYREHTAIRGESVRVQRDGEPPRSFALKHAPELRGLLSGFSALLAGDAEAMRRNFSVEIKGSETAWTLELKPTETRARRRLQQMVVNGRNDQPRCVSMSSADGSTSILLLGEAAHAMVPTDVTPTDLQHRCEGADNTDRGHAPAAARDNTSSHFRATSATA